MTYATFYVHRKMMGNRMKFNELGRKKPVEQSWFPCTCILQPTSYTQQREPFMARSSQQSGSPFLGPWSPTVGIKLQTDRYSANTSRADLHFWVRVTQLSGSNYKLTGIQRTPAEWISTSGSVVPNCQDQTTD